MLASFSRHPARPCPDYATIAVLEYELLYVVPEPGTLAEAAVNLMINIGRMKRHKQCLRCRRAFRPEEQYCPDCSDCPEHGSECSHPLPWDDFECVNGRNARAEQARWETYHEALRTTGRPPVGWSPAPGGRPPLLDVVPETAVPHVADAEELAEPEADLEHEQRHAAHPPTEGPGWPTSGT